MSGLTLAQLDEKLPELCSSVYDYFGSQNLEATYQRAVAIDLEELGLVVESEVSIQLMYKGKVVGTRRCDLIIQTPEGEKAVIEFKAVQSLSPEHFTQLSFYMHHLNIDYGYLINFPHETGFPTEFFDTDLDAGFVYCQSVLSGASGVLMQRSTSRRHAKAVPQIIRVTREASKKKAGSIPPSDVPSRTSKVKREPSPRSPPLVVPAAAPVSVASTAVDNNSFAASAAFVNPFASPTKPKEPTVNPFASPVDKTAAATTQTFTFGSATPSAAPNPFASSFPPKVASPAFDFRSASAPTIAAPAASIFNSAFTNASTVPSAYTSYSSQPAAAAAAAAAAFSGSTGGGHGSGVWGITKKGTPCKVCIEKRGFCYMHYDQE